MLLVNSLYDILYEDCNYKSILGFINISKIQLLILDLTEEFVHTIL